MRSLAALKFGVYEFDEETGELIRDGVRQHLQEQPAKVLRVLLERRGELVTREQLKHVIAADTSFGDFDHALNVAVGKLRTALGDSGDKPIYIETLHKRGYRFIAPVSVDAVVGPVAAEAAEPLVDPWRKTRLKWWIGSSATALLLAAAIFVAWQPKTPSPVYEPVAFTTLQGLARQPAFSPDGSEIAFTWQSDASAAQRLYVQSIGSVVARALVDDEEADHQESMARWFHDGTRVAYIRQVGRNGPREVWTVARSGGQPRKLIDVGPLLEFDVAPDDKSLVTSEGLPGHAGALFVTSLEGKGRHRLTAPDDNQWALSNCCAGDRLPIYAPDGNSVAYFHVEGSRINLLRVSLAGSSPETLLDDVSSTAALVPSFTWAADGKSLIVVAVRHQNPSWGRVWLRGKRWEPLGITGASYPTTPRDGKRLAFVRTSGFVNIWRYDLRPGHSLSDAENLTHSSSEDRVPSLSPDGSRLSFASNRTGNFEIYVSNSDGSSPVQLTFFRAKDAGSPRWSPDGKRITFDYRPDDHSHIFVVDANGGPARQMTSADADDVLPQYSQDGRWLYFTRLRPGGADEWKVPNNGGTLVFVVADSNTVKEAPSGKSLYIQRSNPKGIYSRAIEGGKEELLFAIAGDVTIGPWVVFPDGIYYQQVSPSHELVFYDFATGHSRVLMKFPFPAMASTGISISPDRSYYLEHKDERQSNIMLIENFR